MGDWSHGLFGCFDDFTVCLLSWFVPCYVHAKAAEAVGENFILHLVVWFLDPLQYIFMAIARGKIRENKGIEGSFISDCLVSMFCTPCALAQMYNEVIPPGGQSMARE